MNAGTERLDDELLRLAEGTAREAGAMIRERRDAAPTMAVAATKSTPTDVVTASDTASEQLIRERLLGARPQDGLLGEEGGSVDGTSSVRWVVDPIDGTVNYLYGIPAYCVSIAAESDGVVVVGVVHNPVTGDTWTARRGGGARLNGQGARVSAVDRLDQVLLGTGFGYDAQRRAEQAAVLPGLLPAVRDIRRHGAAALDLCAVGSGRLDAYYESGLKAWDRAAGELVASEAGARVTGLDGGPSTEAMTVASPAAVHGALVDLLRELGAG